MARKWSCGVRALPVLWICDGFIVHMSTLEGPLVDDLALRRSFEQAVAEPASAMAAATRRPAVPT